MKIAAWIPLVFLCLSAFSQAPALESKAYQWGAKRGTKKMFSGSGAILAMHQMSAVALQKGKSLVRQEDSTGNELFFIVKSGPVKVMLAGNTATLDRGSVITVLPGDKIHIENTGANTAQLYEMSYHSLAPPNMARGRKAGPSFMLDWTTVAFKPHDKGGVRQFFDRQTVMLSRFDIHVTTLNVGFNSHAPHTHKNEEIILMLEGNAEMQIGNAHHKANPGDAVWVGSNVLHNLTNIGSTPCVYYAIQWN